MRTPNRHPGRRIRTAVLGATGTVGQRFVSLLAGHPWFELEALAASERSAGKPYRDAVTWVQTQPLPPAVAGMPVQTCEQLLGGGYELVFSALGTRVATAVEPEFARDCLLVTNASSYRMAAEVPLLVPEVNPDHLRLLPAPPADALLPTGMIANPNCSTIGLALALKPLADAFGVDRVSVVTLQAVSGAGLPGISGYQILDNVIPWIPNEEEKLEIETTKILGRLAGGAIEPARLTVSTQCNRVPVVDGHTPCVSAGALLGAELAVARTCR
ncbi:aspartate-semialdehyde dehydrogenase [Candidatus Palauibacter sp.]|uniref:aspartate-semialdehyde dehydrogenase n=1 Tax=Candidatus Palauibacter sp. TaxID=3101350 RepID=UPI003B028122